MQPECLLTTGCSTNIFSGMVSMSGNPYTNQGEFMRIFKNIILILGLAFLSGCGTETGEQSSNEGQASGKIPAVIKIGLIDPMTGAFAQQGSLTKGHIQRAIDEANEAGIIGDAKLEMVVFDNKASPQESLVALKSAISQGIRYVAQGAGSHVAHSLTDAVRKHNDRNPGDEVMFLNLAAIDPPLTNEKCHFYHFRFDAHVFMKSDAITTAIAKRDDIKKVYLFNQDYSYGHSVQKSSNEMLAEKRPDIEIVGDELHPLGKIKDFAPYVAKIKASGADAIYTGNWGSDLGLFAKAVGEAGLDVSVYTNYAYLIGTPRAIGDKGVNRVKTVLGWHANIEGRPLESYYLDYIEQYNEDWGFIPQKYAIDIFAAAIRKANSASPKDVAFALEDFRYDGGVGEVWMRPDDHQLIQPLYVATLRDISEGLKYSADSTTYGWSTDVKINADENILPHSCQMVRPSRS